MKHLFLDDEGIELQDKVERRWHQPSKRGRPVLAPEGPLEGRRLHIWNPPLRTESGDGWRMWYIGGEDLNALYAESEDGLHWRRPELGLVEAGGSRANNLVDLGFEAQRKAKRLVMAPNPAAGRGGEQLCALTLVRGVLKPLFSEDGLRWRCLADHPGVPSDDEYRLGADLGKGRLVATVKLGGFKGRVCCPVPEYGRAVALSTSSDGMAWTEPRMVFHADHLDRAAGAEMIARHFAAPGLRSPMFKEPAHTWTDVYNMPVFPCGGMYLALPVMFHQCSSWRYPDNPGNANQDGLLCSDLAWSRDLLRWERKAERVPFIPLSPCDDREVYDNGCIHACAPVRHGDELRFYYYGSRISHVRMALAEEAGLFPQDMPMGGVFMATLRVDGFASLRAGGEGGAVLTKPVTVDGPSLRINANAKGGEIRAEIRDAETGRAIPGFCMGESLAPRTFAFPDGAVHVRKAGFGARFEDDPETDDTVPFVGDEVDAKMGWKGGSDLSALQGRMVRVLFALKNADLYSYGFGEE